jgi:NADH:ubiquinone oxidoreductase subunit F (NADH-binding)
MTTAVLSSAPPRVLPAPTVPRLLGHGPDMATHLGHYGPLPTARGDLLDSLASAGLKGRGGAGFPTARKIGTVAGSRSQTVVVANGTEGEPLSAKDKILLTNSPHLVLDGLALAAGLVGARRRIVCMEGGNPVVEAAVRRALLERNEDGVELITTPRRYLAGQENALVDLINCGDGKPALGRPFERGVNGLPTLVDNVETLAHLALIARFGARWYREVGTPDDAGSTLVTIAGSVGRPGVYEIANGWRLDDVLAHAGADQPRAVLLGGYYGRWANTRKIRGLRLDSASLKKAGLSLGCGVIAVLDDDTCAVDEAARVAAWFAANSAGQCGACTWGLRDLAHATGDLVSASSVSASSVSGSSGSGSSGRPASVRPDPASPVRVLRWAAMIERRGACGLPDGAVSFLRSAFEVFADEIHEHLAGACSRSRRHLLPTPAPEPWK